MTITGAMVMAAIIITTAMTIVTGAETATIGGGVVDIAMTTIVTTIDSYHD